MGDGKPNEPDLTKEGIVNLISKYGFMPINAHWFYWNKHNFDLLMAMWEEGILKERNCQGLALELA